MPTTTPLIRTTQLSRTFKSRKSRGVFETIEAVKSVDLAVAEGEIFGFLGPNGAGKTTTLRMLVTLLAPTSGEARIMGFDLHTQALAIRRCIGYVSQAGGADPSASARENLVLQARLYEIRDRDARDRAQDLIDRLDMADFADRRSASYSGGQRRRLDLALGMVHHPPLLFLDEPTLGLDPQSRARFWEEMTRLNREGTTIFLTTHYLDEADKLCHRLAIIDHGVIAAAGTPDQLKKEIKGDAVLLRFASEAARRQAEALLTNQPFVKEHSAKDAELRLYVQEGALELPLIIRTLDSNKIPLVEIDLAKPSLDDVFLHKTGRSLREETNM